MRPESIGLQLCGSIFGVVAVIHLLRIITGISVLIGESLLVLRVIGIGLSANDFPGIWLWLLSINGRLLANYYSCINNKDISLGDI